MLTDYMYTISFRGFLVEFHSRGCHASGKLLTAGDFCEFFCQDLFSCNEVE